MDKRLGKIHISYNLHDSTQPISDTRVTWSVEDLNEATFYTRLYNVTRMGIHLIAQRMSAN